MKTYRWTRRLSLASMLVLCTACSSMRTPYTTPAVALPAAWPHALALEAGAPLSETGLPWHRTFADPELDRLVTQVLGGNRDLAAAAFRLQGAQLQAGLTEQDRLPQLQAGVSARGEWPRAAASTRSVGATLSVSYEVDLWDRLAALNDKARWEATATATDRQALRNTLVASATTSYFQSAYLSQALALTQQTLTDARRTLALVQAQYDAGATSMLELSEARRVLHEQEAATTRLTQQQVLARQALALLAGDSGLVMQAPELLPAAPPPMEPDIPAHLLARRPDLRAAEMRLRADLAHVDAVRTSFYPALTLTGSGGTSSAGLHSLLRDPVATLVGSVGFPLVNAGRARLSTALARASYDEGVARFQQTLLTAFFEVDGALSAREQLRHEGVELQQALDLAHATERLYEIRYREGAVSLRDWLAAQQTRRSAELAVLSNRLERLNAYITARKALGGEA